MTVKLPQGFIRMKKVLLLLRKLPITLLLLVIITILNAYLFYFQVTAISQNQKLLQQSVQGLTDLEGLRSAFKQGELTQHSYLVTGGEQDLEKYQQAVTAVLRNLNNLRQRESVEGTVSLQQQLTATVDRWNREIELSQSQFPTGVRGMGGGQQNQEIYTGLERISANLHRRSQSYLQKSRYGLNLSLTTYAIAMSANMGLVGLLLYHLHLAWSRHHHHQMKLQQQGILLAMTSEGMLIHDLQYRICEWNQGAERLYGWKRERVLGASIVELLYPHDLSLSAQAMSKTLATGCWQGEMQQINSRGEIIVVKSSWRLLYNEDGNPLSVLVTNREITEQKRLERIMLRSQRLEMMGTLAGGVAHDLNNILSPILLSVQLLEMKLGDPEHQKLLKTLEKNVKRGANLVKQVLSLARGIESQLSQIDIYTTLADVEEFIHETFPKCICFHSHIAKNLPTIHGNNTQLYQVLMNLVINARDAMPEGGTIELAAQIVEVSCYKPQISIKPGTYLVITVKDSGIGMTPQIRDRIFEPFFTTKQANRGSGLGLYSAQLIIQNHGGIIDVETQIGKGTCFHVYLPVDVCGEYPAHLNPMVINN
ncbi:multi-sensor signal transduction histidine kinase [Calothrix sp. NIES-3974]|nr:multi-sensor signal transduction histidine kinase [Calothrix sp. NIES-3974]